MSDLADNDEFVCDECGAKHDIEDSTRRGKSELLCPKCATATRMITEPCPDCGGDTMVVCEDELLGERGPYTIVCEFGHDFHVPAETTARSRIAALRAIVREHKATRIDGFIVDAFTAQMLVKLYEALQPGSRERFGEPRLEKLVDFGWKHTHPREES